MTPALRTITRSERDRLGRGSGKLPGSIPGRITPLGWESDGRTFVWSPNNQTWEEVRTVPDVPKPNSLNLQGKVEDAGAIHFLRAEWLDADSRFVLVRYSIDAKEDPYGLRMDLDKRVFLDDLASCDWGNEIKAREPQIWQAIVNERFAKA
jgi:hypothetical protein